MKDELRIYINPPTGTRSIAARVFAEYLIDHNMRFAYQPGNTSGGCTFTILDNPAGRKAAQIIESINPVGVIKVVES